MIDINALFYGTFNVGDRQYEVTEDDYLAIDAIDEYTSIEALISAAKHVAIQRSSDFGDTLQNITDLRGDYHFSQDPIDWEGTVLIFDGNNTAHRVKHTTELTYKQQDVSISYGVLNIIAATIKKFKHVTSVIVCWDGGVPQFRYDRVPTYKRREHSDDDGEYQEFVRQVQELHNVLPSFGVYSIRKPKAEADDLIYHASRLVHPDYQKVIISTDKDLLQCINRDTVVWQPYKELLIDRQNFKEYTGLAQSDFLVYRSMVGDSSDGIPGIKGIGDKTALKLIEDYGASPSNIINVATGANPEAKPMSSTIAEKVSNFGLKGFTDVMTAIRLDIDRCGAKLHIAETLKQNCEFDPQAVNNFLKKYAFASLMSAQFYDCFKNLHKPVMTSVNLRFPRVFDGDRQPL